MKSERNRSAPTLRGLDKGDKNSVVFLIIVGVCRVFKRVVLTHNRFFARVDGIGERLLVL